MRTAKMGKDGWEQESKWGGDGCIRSAALDSFAGYEWKLNAAIAEKGLSQMMACNF